MKTDFHLDKAKVKQSFAAAANTYDAMAALQRQVGLDLLAKFPLSDRAGQILDLGCGTGFLSRQLPLDQDGQSLLAIDIALPMLEKSRELNQQINWHYVCADAERLPLQSASVQQVFSNLAFQWCEDLSAVFSECRRVLVNDGQLQFATFGPATLKELKAAWAQVDDFEHVNQFVSLSGIRQNLIDVGFVDFELQSQIYPVSYASVMDLMRELKAIGAHNVSEGRNKKMTTRRQLQAMIQCYEYAMPEQAILASYEIIFVRAK